VGVGVYVCHTVAWQVLSSLYLHNHLCCFFVTGRQLGIAAAAAAAGAAAGEGLHRLQHTLHGTMTRECTGCRLNDNSINVQPAAAASEPGISGCAGLRAAVVLLLLLLLVCAAAGAVSHTCRGVSLSHNGPHTSHSFC
jgi:hypothetical protein